MKTWDSRPEWTDNDRSPIGNFRSRVRLGHHGNGNPDRPSVLKRQTARAADPIVQAKARAFIEKLRKAQS